MNLTRLSRLVAGLLATTILVVPLAAQALDDRVEKSTTMERGSSNGTNGYWVSITERVFRWVTKDDYVNRIADLFPNDAGLAAFELGQLDVMFKTMNLTDAEIVAAINAIKNWNSTQPGNNSNMATFAAGHYSSMKDAIKSKAPELASAISAAIGNRPIASMGGSPAHGLVSRLAVTRSWFYNSDPLVFDLNRNGKIDVTGLSSAKTRAEKNQRFVREGSVLFDVRGNGTPDRIEWITGGDGILVDNRKKKAEQLVAQGKPLSIFNLFGDSEGNPGGFFKLASLFDIEAKIASGGSNVKADNLGLIKGKELGDLLMWVDNGDGKTEPKELHTLASLGITEIRLPHRHLNNQDGELIEQATFVRDGKTHIVQEVWFSRDEEKAAEN